MALAVLQKAGVTLPPTINLSNSEYLLIYLSAQWCPPCRGFTPHLAAWVAEHAARHKATAIFVSGDSSEGEALAYNEKMRFPMANFSKAAFSALMAAFGLRGIPSLVVLRVADGAVVTKRAREKMLQEPGGFPWAPAEGESEEAEGGNSVMGFVTMLALLLLVGFGVYKLSELGFKLFS